MPSNAEIVRAFSEPMAEVDFAEIDWRSAAVRNLVEDVYAPDLELKTLESGIGSGVDRTFHGIEGIVEYFVEWFEPFGEYHVEWLDYIEVGDFVLVPSHQWGIGSSSGIKVELDLVWAYEIRDGKVSRAFQYDTLDQAREAVTKIAQAEGSR